MTLIIGATPHSQWDRLEPLLQHLGWQTQPKDQAETWYLQQNPGADKGQDTRLLLLHSRPEPAIARALDQGQDPDEALAQWQTAAQKLLDLYRQHRNRAAMVVVDDAHQEPAALVDWLRTNHPAFKNQAAWAGALDTDAPDSISQHLSGLMATQLVAQTNKLNGLLNYLEASSIPLTDKPYAPPVIDVKDIHQNQDNRGEEQAKKVQAIEALEEESDLLLRQLHKVQEELENYYHETRTLNGKQKEYEQKIQQLTEELEEAKRAFSEKDQTLNKLEANEDGKAADLQEENDLILKQLFKVQEELEKYYLDNKALKDKYSQAKDQIQAKNEKLDKFSQDKKELNRQVKKLQKTINQLNSELEQLHQHQTLGYRIKAPLRLARAVMHKLSPKRWRLGKYRKLIQNSELFDADWYLEQYPDVKSKRVDPAKHYLLFGGKEGRAPSPNFCSRSYLDKNPDVAQSGQNPLVHYLLYGKAEGRKC